jgi:hydrogenase expression/formation protein HypE
VAPDNAQQALEAWQAVPSGRQAAVVGELCRGPAQVILRTELGGERLLNELEDDPLPRIC